MKEPPAIRIYAGPWRVIGTVVHVVQQSSRATRIDLAESNGIALRWRSIAIVDLPALPKRIKLGSLPRAIAWFTGLRSRRVTAG